MLQISFLGSKSTSGIAAFPAPPSCSVCAARNAAVLFKKQQLATTSGPAWWPGGQLQKNTASHPAWRSVGTGHADENGWPTLFLDSTASQSRQSYSGKARSCGVQTKALLIADQCCQRALCTCAYGRALSAPPAFRRRGPVFQNPVTDHRQKFLTVARTRAAGH